MIEEIRSLAGGMDKDASFINQPDNTYREALNFVQLSKDGDIFAISNERGTIEINTELPSGFKVMGYHVIDNDIVVALVNGEYSQIGKITITGEYQRMCPSINEDNEEANTNSELGLSEDRPVNMEARKRLGGSLLVYFCDGTNGRPMGFVDEDDIPSIGNIFDATKIIPNQKAPIIDLREVRDTGGQLYPGAYFFCTRYLTEDLTTTSFSEVSPMVPVPKGTGSRDEIDGDYFSYGSTGKSIVLDLSNLDTSFAYIQLISIRYEGDSDTLTIEAMPEIGIDSSTASVVFSGNEDDTVPLTQEELAQLTVSYSAAKCVSQKDNILLWSNLADNSQRFDEELQKFFNNVEVRYEIEEVVYRGSSAEDVDTSFFLEGSPYIDETDDTIIYLTFSNELNFINTLSTSNFTVNSGGSGATIDLTCTNSVAEGTTVTVVGNGTQVYQATSGSPMGLEFDISSNDSETIAYNLARAILNYGSEIGISASSSGSVATINVTQAGVFGNFFTATSSDAVNITGGGSFSGGIDNVSSSPTTVEEGDDIYTVKLTMASSVDSYSTMDYTAYNKKAQSISGSAVTLSEVKDISNTTSSVQGSFTDYKDPLLTFYSKTYKRGETYSLGALVTFNDSSKSFNYHIPGNNKTTPANGDLTARRIEASNGILGTYINGVTRYPINQSYPGTTVQTPEDRGDQNTCYDATVGDQVQVVDRHVRHHYMPKLEQEPHFRTEDLLDGSSVTYIRLIKLKFIYNEVMSDALKEAIQSITFTRELRDTRENKTCYAQGLVSRYYCAATDWNDRGGDARKFRWRKIPFFNSVDMGPGDITFRTTTNDGAEGESYDTSSRYKPSNQRLAFFSPDTNLYDLNYTNVVGGKITPVLRLRGKAQDYTISMEYNGGRQMDNYHLQWMYCNWNYNDNNIRQNGSALINSAFIVGKGETKAFEDSVRDVDNGFSSRHLSLRVDDGLDFGVTNVVNLVFGDVFSGFHYKPNGNDNEMTTALMDLITDNADQYGSPSGSDYIPIHTTYTIPTRTKEEVTEVYGGDIYISKFAYRNCDITRYLGQRPSTVDGMFYSDNVAVQHHGTDGDDAKGMNVKELNYFFVESIVNCNYRHRAKTGEEDGNEDFEVPYFPQARLDANEDGNWRSPGGALAPISRDGDTKGYNLQYSYENTVLKYSNKLSSQTVLGNFPNRTIHSEQAREDELSDSYRVYKQNSYYDLPQTKGEIWNTFVYNNTLYLHTTKSLWRAYMNDVTQQATSVGDVVLGTGSIFSIPAREMMVTTGGYAGTVSQWAGCLTPYGYMFPDVLQGKIFLLQGDQLREVSQRGMRQEFFSNMDNLVNDYDYLDNPFTAQGMTSGFDFEIGRVLFTKTTIEDSFTYSYSPMNDAWVSSHSYIPDLYISRNKQFYSVINEGTAKLHQHNVGDYCTFYGTKYDANLNVVFNKEPGIDKTWDNMKLHTVSRDSNGVVDQLDCFNAIRVNSDTRNTGLYDMVVTNQYGSKAVSNGEVKVRRVNNKFNLTIPSDSVIDDSQDIFDFSNLDNTQTFKPRIKGDYISSWFYYDNSNNYQFIVNFISSTFRPNRA